MLDRRTFLEYSSTCVLSALARMIGLISPATLKAGELDEAFAEKTVGRLIERLSDHSKVPSSERIELKIPDVAENGAIVPITISSTLENVQSIAVIAEKNPIPLIGRFTFENGAEPFVQARIKLAESGHVVVLVNADSRTYSTRKFVEVTIGGCGT